MPRGSGARIVLRDMSSVLPAPTDALTDLDQLWHALQAPPAARAPHLGEALVARGLLGRDLLAQALAAQRESRPHRLLGRMLVEGGVITEAQLDTTLAQWLGVQVADLRHLKPEPEALRLLPQALAEREGVLPLMRRDDSLVVAVPDPWDQKLLDELRFVCDAKVVAVAAVPGTLAPAIARAYRPAHVRCASWPTSCRRMPRPTPATTRRSSRSPTTRWCGWSTG